MKIQHFFDQDTFTLSYVVFDEESLDAVIIDPVLDFDPASGRISNDSIQKLVGFINSEKLQPRLVLETHAHADHLSSSQYLKDFFPNVKIAISDRITSVQEVFKKVFNMKDLNADGSDFDILIHDNVEFTAGLIKIKPIPTPGHTPACTSFLIGENVFTGDAIFMPDSGTGRCDFPKGSAATLYESVKRLYSLPDNTKVFVGHDYQPNGRELKFRSTIAECKESNIHIKANTTKEEFISFREGRDKTLKAPRLLLPSLQVNIAAGKLPPKDDNGVSYLKTPLKISF